MTMPLNPSDELRSIRSMMERSSRFISLSGLSGVVAGSAALAGVFAAVIYFGALKNFYLHAEKIYDPAGLLALKFLAFLFVDALLVATIAIGAGIFFTSRRAKANGQPAWGPLTKRMLMSLAIPLATGGILSLILLSKGQLAYILPVTLIFYGIGLVNASKYTLNDVKILGLCEIAIGLLAAQFHAHSLLLWAIGFGFMHILYGTIMWYKYERN
ncbi:MAG: hypothetical protein GY751_10115 [Bacteroidetes bacterium]|nr:hypothetical protein [Bacteroidota bacterium]